MFKATHFAWSSSFSSLMPKPSAGHGWLVLGDRYDSQGLTCLRFRFRFRPA